MERMCVLTGLRRKKGTEMNGPAGKNAQSFAVTNKLGIS